MFQGRGACLEFVKAFFEHFTALSNLTDPAALWETFKHEMVDIFQESISNHPRTRKNLISQETLKATDACHLHHSLMCKLGH